MSTTFLVILAMVIMGSVAEEELEDYYYNNPTNISTLVFDQESNCKDKCEANLSQSVA